MCQVAFNLAVSFRKLEIEYSSNYCLIPSRHGRRFTVHSIGTTQQEPVLFRHERADRAVTMHACSHEEDDDNMKTCNGEMPS